VSTWTAGTAVNLEFDMIGKYVVRALQQTEETPDPEALARQWLDR
jgi:riboflavin synthase